MKNIPNNRTWNVFVPVLLTLFAVIPMLLFLHILATTGRQETWLGITSGIAAIIAKIINPAFS